MNSIDKITALLDTLEEPYRTEALANIDHEYIGHHGFVEHSSNEIANALWSSCRWVITPQGHKYWVRLYMSLAKGTPTELALKKYIKQKADEYSHIQTQQFAYETGALSEAAKDYWYEQFRNESDNQ